MRGGGTVGGLPQTTAAPACMLPLSYLPQPAPHQAPLGFSLVLSCGFRPVTEAPIPLSVNRNDFPRRLPPGLLGERTDVRGKRGALQARTRRTEGGLCSVSALAATSAVGEKASPLLRWGARASPSTPGPCGADLPQHMGSWGAPRTAGAIINPLSLWWSVPHSLPRREQPGHRFASHSEPLGERVPRCLSWPLHGRPEQTGRCPQDRRCVLGVARAVPLTIESWAIHAASLHSAAETASGMFPEVFWVPRQTSAITPPVPVLRSFRFPHAGPEQMSCVGNQLFRMLCAF